MSISRQFSETGGVINYGCGWRKDVVMQWLEFVKRTAEDSPRWYFCGLGSSVLERWKPQKVKKNADFNQATQNMHIFSGSNPAGSNRHNILTNDNENYKHKTHGFRTFSCFGPHIWNSLQQDLRHCSTLSSFKSKLKTFLFSQYFHPN